MPLTIEGYKPPNNSNKTQNGKIDRIGSVILEYSSFNRLRFNVFSHKPGFFALFFPHSHHWRAYVNSEKAPIYRAYGIFQAVWVSEGKKLIELRYWSFPAFWGMLVSCITFSLVALYFLGSLLSGPVRMFSIFCVLALGTGVFLWWYFSLYSGDDLGTKYIWTSKPQDFFETLK